MNTTIGSGLRLWMAAFLLGAALLPLSPRRAAAQDCPEPNVILLRPTNGAANLSGKVRVDAAFPYAPSGYHWNGDYYIDVLDGGGNLVERIATAGGVGGSCAV